MGGDSVQKWIRDGGSGLQLGDDAEWPAVVAAVNKLPTDREIVICAYDNAVEAEPKFLGKVVVTQSLDFTKDSFQPCCSKWWVRCRFMLHPISLYYQR